MSKEKIEKEMIILLSKWLERKENIQSCLIGLISAIGILLDYSKFTIKNKIKVIYSGYKILIKGIKKKEKP